ncbi:histidine kinase [Saccharomonospora sp. NPDC006951]
MKAQTEARGRLRTLNIVMFVPPLALVGALLVAVDAENWWQAIVLSLGVLAGMVATVRWAAGDVLSVAIPCTIVAAAVWVFGGLVLDSSTAFYGISIVGPFLIPELKRHQGRAAVALAGFVASVGFVKLLMPHDDTFQTFIAYLLVPAGVTVLATGLMFPNKRFYDVVDELEESRQREAELAVVRERMRFASDLHDIQGHTLHVVKLKTALARKLVHTDIERAEEELKEIYALVGDTIAQTKELAHAQRRLNLSAELENAKNLFEAAGIRVRVEREAEVDASVSELLGQVLRETTTNILRHSQAAEVRVTLSNTGIVIVNDGAAAGPLPELGGLATLSERVAGDGGELTVEQKEGRFSTAAMFPGTRAVSAKGNENR